MEELIKRLILKLFPELTARYHLPMFACVVAVRETPHAGAVCDEFRPYYAVDIQILDEHGEPDLKWPVLQDVPLTLPTIGQEMGFLAYPEVGARVEVAFAYGSPNAPFIRSVLPHGMSLPGMELGEQRWQHNPASFQRVDKAGNWERKTDVNIIEDSLKRLLSAVENSESYTKSTKTVKADDSETVGGAKTIKAFGLINFLSGGRFDVGALHDINLTSLTKQRYKSPKTWIGSQDENVLQLLSELMQLTIDLANLLASHTHTGDSGGATSQPIQSSSISGNGSSVGAVKVRLDGIKD